jgi:nitric oxide reductase NorD protein
MAEAEDVIVDAARHATNYAHALWRRRAQRDRSAPLSLAELGPRLALLIAAVTGRTLPLRTAQESPPRTLLAQLFRRSEGPLWTRALPATDGSHVWLPAHLSPLSSEAALGQYRVMALQQAMRATRGSACVCPGRRDPLVADLYLLFETVAADSDLVRTLPGMAVQLRMLRDAALAGRPPLRAFPPPLRALEAVFRRQCAAAAGVEGGGLGAPTTKPSESLAEAEQLAAELRSAFPGRSFGSHPLYRDIWLGELRALATQPSEVGASATDHSEAPSTVRSARLLRRPKVRQADEDEDQAAPGAWMVQTSQPQEQAEDPHGLQRPTDRDDATMADELADALSELPEARLVSTASRPREVLLSEDPPETRVTRVRDAANGSDAALTYPEWDYRIGAYRTDAVTVHLVPCGIGAQSWIEQTLDRHRGMLQQIRRQFEVLRARRSRLRKQVDGDEIDLEAYLESTSDFRAGLPLAQRLYQTQRRVHRDLAVMLLVDVSGSTDSWVAGHRRIIDVEREALLLVCAALEGLVQPYAVQTFSGEGPERVTMRNVKGFDEDFSSAVARRISSLEPEQYTRVGAAVRHATTLLMRQQAQHRLLLLLSDGKPNDVDQYNGRYGVADFRQAVAEAKLQGVSPFCLTIDRQAASYLPLVFGAGHYALLTRPELLPVALLDWVRRLVAN